MRTFRVFIQLAFVLVPVTGVMAKARLEKVDIYRMDCSDGTPVDDYFAIEALKNGSHFYFDNNYSADVVASRYRNCVNRGRQFSVIMVINSDGNKVEKCPAKMKPLYQCYLYTTDNIYEGFTSTRLANRCSSTERYHPLSSKKNPEFMGCLTDGAKSGKYLAQFWNPKDKVYFSTRLFNEAKGLKYYSGLGGTAE